MTIERARRDVGASDALAMALIAPAAIAMAIVVLFVSRGVDTRATAQSAAEAAAQAAAQERSYAAGAAAARQVGAAMLTDPTTCANPSVAMTMEGGAFAAGATVAVTVSCTRATGDLALISPGGDNTATYTAFAVIDPYRAVDT